MSGEADEQGQEKAIARLWAQAAHDLRQPVQAALLLARALEGTSGPSELARNAGHIEAALKSLGDMLELLTMLSRIEAGQRIVRLGACELGHLLGPVIRDISAIAAERGTPLRSRGIEGLVRTNPKLCVTATRSLLINAMKIAGGGEIFLDCRRAASQLLLEARFRGPWPDLAGTQSAFVQLPPQGGAAAPGEMGLGLGLLEHLCRRLGHCLQHTRLPDDEQLLAIGLPLAAG